MGSSRSIASSVSPKDVRSDLLVPALEKIEIVREARQCLRIDGDGETLRASSQPRELYEKIGQSPPGRNAAAQARRNNSHRGRRHARNTGCLPERFRTDP